MERVSWEEPIFRGAKIKMKALQELSRLSNTVLNSAMQEWKNQGKPIVGYFCTYVPEEIIHAAGLLPYRVRPTGCTATTEADAYLSHVNCTYVRSCLEFALEHKYDFLDGVVFSNSCDHVRRLHDLWREKAPGPEFDYIVEVPHKSREEQIAFFREDLALLKTELERHFGSRITDESLSQAVAVYNETRGLLRQLYDLRQQSDPPISGADCLRVVLASMAAPKAEINELLRRLLSELADEKGKSDHIARLMVLGSLYDDPAHTEVIEKLGGLVVADALCFGSRYFWQHVEIDGDPLVGLARSYLTRPSCARMTDGLTERGNFVKELIDRYKVDGVIFQRIRYCDLWGGELFYLRKKLQEWGIPLLSLEREYALGGTGQLKTRVQAFLERIGG
jgi:benzoyl-CoA reductase subunit C